MVLLRGSPGLDCVASCESGEQALAEIPSHKPDVVLVDIQLPGMSGIECIGRLRKALPKTRVMMLTIFDDHERIFCALAAGATGYLLKKTPPAQLLEAIQDLHHGGAPMSSQIARQVVEVFQKRPSRAAEVKEKLSKREWEVLNLLAQGFLYKEIAGRLNISIGTVRVHICRIYEKLHVNNRTEAVLKILPKTGGI